jgi:hypothetical protein
MQGENMKQSGRTTLFVLVCIAVLCAAYGLGLGVRNLRMAGFKLNISMGNHTEKPAGTPEPESKSEPKPADTPEPASGSESKPSQQVAAVVAKPAPANASVEESPEASTERSTASAERADLRARRQRSQDRTAAGQPEATARRQRGDAGRGRGQGRGGRAAFQQLSDEDRADLRAKLEALGARVEAGEISEEERRQARSELLQQYGINGQERGARRPGSRQ